MPDITEITHDDWKVNTNAMTICGGSGAGKTTMIRCLMDQWDGTAILFDMDHEPDMGEVVESVAELRAELERGTDRIAVRPPVDVIQEPELFEEVVRFLIKLGNALREAGEGKILFVMDEAQDLQEKWRLVAMKRLRKRRIKPIEATQDPVSIPRRDRNVAQYNAWLSKPPAEMRDSLKQLGYPVEMLDELPAYDMLVFDEDWSPDSRFRAPEEYAE